MAVCIQHTDLAFPISLSQQGPDNFTVVYGKQIRRNLSYAQAAVEYGACVMHALACMGRLDNRTRAEARGR